MLDRKHIYPPSAALCRALLWAGVVCGALLSAGGTASADVTEIMREIQRAGKARVVITMKTGGPDRIGWSNSQPVAQQKRIVASVGADIAQRMKAANIPLTHRYITLPFVGAVVDTAQLAALAGMPEVLSVRLVQVQRRLPLPAVPNAAFETPQTASLTNAITSIDVPDAWAAGYEGSGLTVAVLDGGFNVDHIMLSGKNVGDACFADSFGDEIIPACPSGQTPEIGTGAASNCPADSDRCDHGTHVTSIAVGNDGTNFGVAREAEFMPIDVFAQATSSEDCAPDPAPCEVTTSLAVLDALDYVIENADAFNIAAINLSFAGIAVSGYCDDDPRKTAIDNLRAKGIAVMAAAGNEGLSGKIGRPACISTTEAVGTTNSATTVASFTNFADRLDMMAPGVSITAASGTGDELITLSGTSMAVPHAAGAWTLVRSAYPSATADQISLALKNSGIAVTRPGAGFSVPKIQVMQAINLLAGRDRQIVSQVVSSNARTLGYSFVRVYNGSPASGRVTFTLRDADTGTAVGTWTSPDVAAHASPQFSIASIEQNAVPADGQTVAQDDRRYYNIEADSEFDGLIQYVLWAIDAGIIGNHTSCPAGVIDDRSVLPNVDAASNADYVSHIRVVNSGSVAGRATLTFYNPPDGVEVARWTTPLIAPGAALELAQPEIEIQVSAISSATALGTNQYNVVMSNFTGYMQHIVANQRQGVLTDMTARCELRASENTAAAASY